jgi:hypothetical protein
MKLNRENFRGSLDSTSCEGLCDLLRVTSPITRVVIQMYFVQGVPISDILSFTGYKSTNVKRCIKSTNEALFYIVELSEKLK